MEDIKVLIKKNGSKNLGWKTNRLTYDPNDIENALSSHWREENVKNYGLNQGQGILQNLFFTATKNPLSIFDGSYRIMKISNRDRLVAATVIQWLGTNVGFCFLSEALKKAGFTITKDKK